MGINNGDGAQNSYQMQGHCRVNRIVVNYTEPPINHWTHWAISTSSEGTRLYINGELSGKNNLYVTNTDVINKDLAIGVVPSPGGIAPYVDENLGYFQGALDDILIYNRALTPEEITSLFTVESDLVILNDGFETLSPH